MKEMQAKYNLKRIFEGNRWNGKGEGYVRWRGKKLFEIDYIKRKKWNGKKI